jgi:hypothetical protein
MKKMSRRVQMKQRKNERSERSATRKNNRRRKKTAKKKNSQKIVDLLKFEMETELGLLEMKSARVNYMQIVTLVRMKVSLTTKSGDTILCISVKDWSIDTS